MKTRTMQFARVSLLVLAAGFASGCATKGYNRGDYNLLTIEQERQWGDQIRDEVDRQLFTKGQLENDPVVLDYVDRLGRRLLEVAPEVKFKYSFAVMRSPVVNAFALPGGHVYVTTGLIVQADNEAELAGAIAHEIGHGICRHSSERLSALLTAAMAGDILVSTQTSQVNRVLTDVAVEVAINTSGLAYSRANEYEADLVGVQILYEAGYDPRALQHFFQKLREEKGEMNEAQIFFSTHPDPADRRSRVRDYIQSVDLHDGLILDTPEFQAVKRRVAGTE